MEYFIKMLKSILFVVLNWPSLRLKAGHSRSLFPRLNILFHCQFLSKNIDWPPTYLFQVTHHFSTIALENNRTEFELNMKIPKANEINERKPQSTFS